MSEVVDLHANAGGGGLGDDDGGGDDFGAVDQVFEGLETPQGAIERTEAPEFEVPGEGDEGDGGGEWYDELPDDLREKVIAKGYRSPAELARAYDAAESRLGEFSSEIGALRDEVANMASQRGPDGQGYGPEPRNEPQVPTMDQVAGYAGQIAGAIDDGQMDVGAGIAKIMEAVAGVSAAREEYLLSLVEDRVGERTAPLEQTAFRTEVAREIQAIKQQIGPEAYAEHSKEVQALLKDWERQQPGFVQNARAVRAAFGEVMLRTQAQARRERGSRVLDRTGRGGQRRGPSPAQQIVDEMIALDGGGLGGGL